MNPLTINATAGIVLSLALSYIPGLAPWFDALGPVPKRLALLAALFIACALPFGAACGGLPAAFAGPVTCTPAGAASLLPGFLAALVTSQATYTLTPPKPLASDRMIDPAWIP